MKFRTDFVTNSSSSGYVTFIMNGIHVMDDWENCFYYLTNDFYYSEIKDLNALKDFLENEMGNEMGTDLGDLFSDLGVTSIKDVVIEIRGTRYSWGSELDDDYPGGIDEQAIEKMECIIDYGNNVIKKKRGFAGFETWESSSPIWPDPEE